MNENFRSLLFPLYLLRTLLPSFVIIPTQLSYARTRAGTDLELKTKVCPSFFCSIFLFSPVGCGKRRVLFAQRTEAWTGTQSVSRWLKHTARARKDLEFKQNKHWVFYSCSKQASDRAIASCERRLGNQNFAKISFVLFFGFCIISGEQEESYAKNGKKYTGSTSFVKSVSTC